MENKTLPNLATSDPQGEIPAGGDFPGMPGTLPGGPRLGMLWGHPPGVQEVEKQQQAQNQPSPGAHGPWKEPPGRAPAGPCRALGRTGSAVASLAPDLAPRASSSSSLPAAGMVRKIHPGISPSTAPSSLASRDDASHGWQGTGPVATSIISPYPW